MEEDKRTQGSRLQQLIHIDIGMVIFFIILIYILFSIIMYATSRKTEIYEVRKGTLNDNLIYHGIALRQEILMDSPFTGQVNYYNREGDHVRVGGLAYSVSESGKLSDHADAGMRAGEYITGKDLASFRSQTIRFVKDFSPAHFSSVYGYKSSSASQAQKITNRAILSGIDDPEAAKIHKVAAADTGAIVYSYDSYTAKDFAHVTLDDFDRSACRTTQLENGGTVRKNQPACRIVTDENWSVAIAVDSEETANTLADKEFVDVRFLKNNTTSRATPEKRKDGAGNWFVNLCFSNSMEAFCMDRFVDIEILIEQEKNLKVPLSSITYGDFFLVPKDFVSPGTNGQTGVLLKVYTAGGGQGTQFIPLVPYSETETEYYLDNSVLRDGEILKMQNSTAEFTLGKKEKLTGVYYINKGYPDFRQVEIKNKNSEYALVRSNELYGLQEYDYIVLYADSIRFNQYVR